MPYPTEHAARIRQPGEFEQGSFRRVNNKFGPGAHAIFGRLKGKSSMEVQAIRFAKGKWTAERAKAWLDEHGYKPISFEPASSGDAPTKKASALVLEDAEVFSFKEVPASALCFGVEELTISEANGPDAKSAPLRMKVRSGQPINHWFWGKVTHDLTGMRMKSGRVAVDYNHDPKEIVGYLNHFDISSGDLHCTGALVPYKDTDRATEIYHKSRQGVPYEASIFFGGGETVLEEVPEGECAEVNGYKFDGPGVIFREWPLRGVAVCPYGADQNTETALDEKTFSVKVLGASLCESETEEETKMDKEVEAAKLAAVEAEKKAKEETEVKAKAEAEEAARLAAVEAEKANPGLRFRKAFGDKGCIWFVEGLTFDQAQERFNAELREENVKLTKENAELQAKLAAIAKAGAPAPAASSAPAPDAKPKTFADLVAAKLAANPGMTKTAAMSAVVQEAPEVYAEHRKGKR